MDPVVLLPFHHDERLGADTVPVPAGVAADVVEPALPDGDQRDRLVALFDALADRVAAAIGGPGPVTVLTGDCLAGLGVLAGAQRAGLEPSVVWFDAHGDVHTRASSTSGYLGGLALRMVVGGDRDEIAGPLGLRPLDEARVILVDARDLDPAEADYLAASRIRRRTVDAVALDDLPEGPVVVHVDLDVIDAPELPGLRFPVAGGPGRAAVVDAVRRLRAGGRVVALDLACTWHDPSGGTDQEPDHETHRAVVAELMRA